MSSHATAPRQRASRADRPSTSVQPEPAPVPLPLNPNQALWEKGDFTAIAALMRESGAAVVQSLRLNPAQRVLDLGCGDGTTALPLALLGHDVLGVDIARNLVAAGNKRAAELCLRNLKFQKGDACKLTDLADHSFDVTLSMFGAMFAPKPLDVAKEMVRVTKPGGRIVMGNWIPNDPTSFVSQLLKISSAFTPKPPEGFISPMLWGDETQVLERFAQAGVPKEKVRMVKDTFSFVSPHTSDHIVDTMRRFYGPTMNAYEAAQKNGLAPELHQRLLELAKAQGKTTSAGTTITATYLRVTVSL